MFFLLPPRFIQAANLVVTEPKLCELALIARSRPLRVGITDVYSSGRDLAEEWIRRGHEVVVIQTKKDEDIAVESLREDQQEFKSKHPQSAVVVADGNLSQHLDRFRHELRLDHIQAGSESGVEVNDYFAYHLGLLGNGLELSPARRNKILMGQAVEKELRTPRLRNTVGGIEIQPSPYRTAHQFGSSNLAKIKSWIQWWLTQPKGAWPVIVKAPKGAATVGVYKCSSMSEVENAFWELKSQPDAWGDPVTQVLVQEYLPGRELVLDTVGMVDPRNGQPKRRVMPFTEYLKSPAAGHGGIELYDIDRIHPFDHPDAGLMIGYGHEVLNGLGNLYGAGHTEMKLVVEVNPLTGKEELMPVLVESGARNAGGKMPLHSKIATGISQVEATVDAFENPMAFLDSVDESYPLLHAVHVARLQVETSGKRLSLEHEDRIRSLPGYRYHEFDAKDNQPLAVSVDMDSLLATVVFVSDDPSTNLESIAILKKWVHEGLFFKQD